MTDELTRSQVKEIPTAALKLIAHALRTKLVPEAMKRAQSLQRSLLWVNRELKNRPRESNHEAG